MDKELYRLPISAPLTVLLGAPTYRQVLTERYVLRIPRFNLTISIRGKELRGETPCSNSESKPPRRPEINRNRPMEYAVGDQRFSSTGNSTTRIR